MKNYIFLLVLLFASCKVKQNQQLSNPDYLLIKADRKIDKTLVDFLGEDLLKILLNADSVHAYLLDVNDKNPNTPKFAKIPIYQQAKTLNFRQQDYLVAALTLRDNYGLDDLMKNCIFNPGIGFEIFQQKQKVQALVCLDCDEWEFVMEGQANKREDCDAARPMLIRLCKQLFPEDAYIQQLKK
jgi:hypothetical protein